MLPNRLDHGTLARADGPGGDTLPSAGGSEDDAPSFTAASHDGTNGTLARIQTGESMRISRILFGALRAVCDDLGIRENERFRCRATTAAMLVLEADDGHIVSLARDWARFIRVEPVELLSHG